MKIIILFILILFICDANAGLLDSTRMGPYVIVFKYLEKCQSGPSHSIDLKIQTQKISKTKFSASLNATLPYPLNQEVGIKLSVSVFGNGGWKPNFYNGKIENLCEAFQIGNPKVFKQLTRQTQVPNECPIPKGKLYLKDYLLDMDDISNNPVKVFSYASFRVDMIVTRHQHSIACIRFFVDTKPK